MIPLNWEALTERMIEEMGVDRHMEEVLRMADLTGMDEKTFRCFLVERGYTEAEASKNKRGEKDITLLTDPHLGGSTRGSLCLNSQRHSPPCPHCASLPDTRNPQLRGVAPSPSPGFLPRISAA